MNLNAGEKILFRRGTTYYGSINARFSGAAGSPITYGAYGTGANPVITGFTTVSGWTNLGGSIWESTGVVTTLSKVNVVSVNGVDTGMGRFPNANATNGGFLTYQSHVGKTSITSSSLSGTPNWTGAEAVVRTSRWTLDRATITSQSGSTLNFTLPQYDGSDGYGFFIQNDARTLDAQNEWYFNPTTKKLRIFSATQPTDVRVASVENLFVISGNYIVVDGLSFSGANSYGVYCAVSTFGHNTIQNSSVLYSGVDGIYHHGSYLTINASTISDSHSNGIAMSYSSNSSVMNSVIQNTGVLPGMGKSGIGVRTAIHADTANNVTIQNNRIINTGYVGINSYGSNVVIHNNFVDTYCAVLDDGAGIYTWTGDRTPITSMKITNNIVFNGIGASEGALGRIQANGIYLDDYSRNVEVSGNTVAYAGNAGIFLHASSYNTVQGNTLFRNGRPSDGSQLHLFDDVGNAAGYKILNNIFFSDPTSTHTVEYRSLRQSTINPGGTFNGNYYVQIRTPNAPVRLGTTTTGGVTNVTLSAWKSFSGQDATSLQSPRTITSEADFRFEYNATNSVKIVPLSVPMIDVKGVRYSGSLALQPFTSIILIKD